MNSEILFVPPMEPHAEPQNIAALAGDIEAAVRRHVVLSDGEALCLAYWVLHTYVHDQRDTAAYVAVQSPEKRCGKTTLLTVLAALASRAVVAANITTGALFTVVNDIAPTLLIDEAETFLTKNTIMRGIINCGNRSSTGYVLRHVATARSARSVPSVPSDASPACKKFRCFCPKVVAMIGNIPETIADRSIIIRLKRKLAEETREPLAALDTAELRARCERFKVDYAAAVAAAKVPPVEGLNDRANDTLGPLLAIAGLAGGEAVSQLRAAALRLWSDTEEIPQSPALLLEVMMVYVNSGAQKLFSKQIIAALKNALKDGESTTLHTVPETEMELAEALRPYNVTPATIRIGTSIARGYKLDDLQDAMRRYVPRPHLERKKEEMELMRTLTEEAAAEPKPAPVPMPPPPSATAAPMSASTTPAATMPADIRALAKMMFPRLESRITSAERRQAAEME